jgi:hypothetical protein
MNATQLAKTTNGKAVEELDDLQKCKESADAGFVLS